MFEVIFNPNEYVLWTRRALIGPNRGMAGCANLLPLSCETALQSENAACAFIKQIGSFH